VNHYRDTQDNTARLVIEILRVFQVDYAQKAVEASGTAIDIRGKDIVVFAIEKIITSISTLNAVFPGKKKIS